MTEKIKTLIDKFSDMVDLQEIYLAYLNWVADNTDDEEEMYYDVLECINRFTLPEQQLLQFQKKLDSLLDKYELNDKSIDIEYFENIGERILKKFNTKQK